jgi:KamA family protein
VPVTRRNVHRLPQWDGIPSEIRQAIRIVSHVLPFRTNTYVVDNLIDWKNVPEDPIFQLTFPQAEMLDPNDYGTMLELVETETAKRTIRELAGQIRFRLNPHPAGQLTHNVPELRGRRLSGIQHKYRETVLFFPAQGQTCHAYCTYCFRWPQFAGMPGMKFQARSSDELVAYLETRPDVSDLLVTGGDPMVMKTKGLRRYLEPVLSPELGHVQTIRIGTKALAYWPYRFVTDPDADDLMRFFEEIVASGRHLALMAHFSHPIEMSTSVVQAAVRRLRSLGAEIRIQAPVVRHVNDDPEIWSRIWREGVRLGMIPYYMFVERDTGPKDYFQVTLHRAHRIFREAFNSVSGLARTVRGPSMSAFPGKVQIMGTTQIGRDRLFVLQFLQARNPNWAGKPFFAQFDPDASWLDDLVPAFGKQHFFFENAQEPWAVSTVA